MLCGPYLQLILKNMPIYHSCTLPLGWISELTNYLTGIALTANVHVVSVSMDLIL